jgi:hypothetical protein
LAAAPTPQNFNQGLHFGEALDCDHDAKMDDVACMAVAALEHSEASVTATGEAGSKTRRRQPSGESCAS